MPKPADSIELGASERARAQRGDEKTNRQVSSGDLKGGSDALRNAHMSLRLFRSARIVLCARTGEPFQSVADVEQCVEGLSRALPARDRSGWRIIIDMRLAPIRVQPALDPAFERMRNETHLGFVRVAVVVTTPLGRVRAERLSSGSKVPVRVVGSLQEAVDFLNIE